ncbi:MAG: hypothetical protein EAZ87_10405 [Nostocales cyanobacterium]|nr:MAG: hypothetical protein EAZ87_10405 [Nostocales cyanobacterium]
MDSLELRQKIQQNLLTIAPENLKLIDEFVEFIKYKQDTGLSEKTNYRAASGHSSGHSILRHAGTWVGDDLEECMKLVSETRGKVKINNRINPFE